MATPPNSRAICSTYLTYLYELIRMYTHVQKISSINHIQAMLYTQIYTTYYKPVSPRNVE
jgi:hypothetical protein